MELLSGAACTNSTGVGGVKIGNVGTVAAVSSAGNGSAASTTAAAKTGAGSTNSVGPVHLLAISVLVLALINNV